MKDKIFVFIIGLLVGAVITAAGFLVFEKTNKNNNQMPNGERMKMTEMMQRPDGEEPPAKPDGDQNDGNRPEPPSRNNDSTKSELKQNSNNSSNSKSL